MFKKTAIILLTTLLLFANALIARADGGCSTPDDAQECYFSETGHTVSGAFLTFYRQDANPELIYGYPLTEAFSSPDGGYQVQYFQNSRMESFGEDPVIRLTPLGEKLYLPGEYVEINEQMNPAACRTFSVLMPTVCYQFLEFFDHYGGTERFGLPVSGLIQLNGITAQYFQYARFEWHPENPVGNRVVLGDIGSEYFHISGESPIRLQPVDDVLNTKSGKGGVSSGKRIQTYAFPVKETRANLSTEQDVYTLYVIVRDKDHRAVPGASVEYSFLQPQGEESHAIPLPTNEEGITSTTFRVASSITYQMLRMQVRVTLGELNGETELAFWTGN